MSAIAYLIDHTALRADTTLPAVQRLCAEAVRHAFASVCIPPAYVHYAAGALRGSAVKTGTVIGFPLGYSTTVTKLAEIKDALEHGAQELDMVINVAALKNGNHAFVEAEIAACAAAAHAGSAILKVIVESGLLSDADLVHACNIIARLSADFIKTSTGFSETGATVQAVKTMRALLPQNIHIKASGGIRTLAAAQALLAAGATRLGCSASLSILQEEAAAATQMPTV